MSGSERTGGGGRRERLPDLSALRRQPDGAGGERGLRPQRKRSFSAQPRRVLLGWEFAETIPHPGPRPVPTTVHSDEQPVVERSPPGPAMAYSVGAGVLVLVGLIVVAAGSVAGGMLCLVLGIVLAAVAYRVRQSRLDADTIDPAPAPDARRRERELRENAVREHAWREALRRFEEQPRWHPVECPISMDRVDLVGGTLVGRRAVTTTLVADLLDCGGQVTVLDLTESATAEDLLQAAQTIGSSARLRFLPRDLHDLEEAAQLSSEALVDVLANVVHFAAADGDRTDWATDSEILEGVVEIVKTRLTVDRVLAGLRVLIDEGPVPGQGDGDSPLTVDEYDLLRRRYGETTRGAGITRRAFALANQLRPLAGAGRAVHGHAVDAPLTVLALDRRASELQNAIMASFLVHACVRSLRDLEGGGRWGRTLVVCGADRLDVRNLERIDELAARSGIGLVTHWSTIPDEGASRIGSGNAIVGFMRLGNARDAQAASEQIGHHHVFVLSQLTENVSDTVTDTTGDSYTQTTGTSDATGESRSTSRTRSSGQSRSTPMDQLFLVRLQGVSAPGWRFLCVSSSAFGRRACPPC